jgi:predicted PurR-regulated permease PerM
MTAPTTAPAAAATADRWRLALLIAPAVILFGALLWQMRGILSPLILYPLLCVVLWPHRATPSVGRLLLATGALTTLWFLWTQGSVLAPFLLALAIAYFLAPAVDALERRRIPRGLAILMLLLPFLLILALGIVLLIPAVERQLVSLVGQLPDLARRAADWLLRLRTRFLATSDGLLTDEQAERLRSLQPSDLVAIVNAQWQDVARRIWSTLMGLGRGVGVVLGVLTYLVVTPVVTYYILKAWHRFTARIEELVPPARRAAVFGFLAEYDDMLGRYVRGQLTEATLVGILTGGTLWLLGFPGAVLVGVISGVANLVPYIGLPLSLIPGIAFALVSGDVLPNLLKLAAVNVVVQFIDGSITGPRIVGKSVGLNPVWVMVALVIFGSLLGFVGLLVAVPLAALVKMLVSRAVMRYQGSTLYREAEGRPA